MKIKNSELTNTYHFQDTVPNKSLNLTISVGIYAIPYFSSTCKYAIVQNTTNQQQGP